VAAALLLAQAATGCGAAAIPKGTPTIQVITGLYPLAQAIKQIGGSTVAVTDVVPAGADPRRYRLSSAQVAAVHRAALVVDVGGFEPSFDAAAAHAPVVLDVRARLGTSDLYPWLDPALMSRAGPVIATALAAANPPAATSYRAAGRAFADALASTGIDYQSTLSVCPRRTIATPDAAFAGVAEQYDLTDLVVGATAQPDGTEVATIAGRVSAAGLTTVFSEPFVSPATVNAVAAVAHAKVRMLDPLSGPPPGGWPAHVDYLELMEANLGALSAALGCPDTGTGM
jgi:zinc/manganese transport system substrate-binding protein